MTEFETHNKNFKIIEDVDELIICDEDGYPYIRFSNPNNNNTQKQLEIIEEILLKIDLSEMIQ